MPSESFKNQEPQRDETLNLLEEEVDRGLDSIRRLRVGGDSMVSAFRKSLIDFKEIAELVVLAHGNSALKLDVRGESSVWEFGIRRKSVELSRI